MPLKRNKSSLYIPQEIIESITFRDTEVLRRFISSQNKILPRRKTGLSAKAQRHITLQIKRARELGLLGFRGHHTNRLERRQTRQSKN